MEYRYTIYTMLALIAVVGLMTDWLTRRYCFRHRCHKVEAGTDKLVCPHCHTPNVQQ